MVRFIWLIYSGIDYQNTPFITQSDFAASEQTSETSMLQDFLNELDGYCYLSFNLMIRRG